MSDVSSAVLTETMSPVEARQCIDKITHGFERAANELATVKACMVELYERDGWKAVMQADGSVSRYDNWRDCATAEFGKSMSQVYKYLTAGLVEQSLTVAGEPAPYLPISWSEQLKRLPVVLRRDALELASEYTPEGKDTTVRELRAVVEAMHTAVATRGMVGIGGTMIGMEAAITQELSYEIAADVQRVMEHGKPTLLSARGSIEQCVGEYVTIRLTKEVACQVMAMIGMNAQLIVKGA